MAQTKETQPGSRSKSCQGNRKVCQECKPALGSVSRPVSRSVSRSVGRPRNRKCDQESSSETTEKDIRNNSTKGRQSISATASRQGINGASTQMNTKVSRSCINRESGRHSVARKSSCEVSPPSTILRKMSEIQMFALNPPLIPSSNTKESDSKAAPKKTNSSPVCPCRPSKKSTHEPGSGANRKSQLSAVCTTGSPAKRKSPSPAVCAHVPPENRTAHLSKPKTPKLQTDKTPPFPERLTPKSQPDIASHPPSEDTPRKTMSKEGHDIALTIMSVVRKRMTSNCMGDRHDEPGRTPCAIEPPSVYSDDDMSNSDCSKIVNIDSSKCETIPVVGDLDISDDDTLRMMDKISTLIYASKKSYLDGDVSIHANDVSSYLVNGIDITQPSQTDGRINEIRHVQMESPQASENSQDQRQLSSAYQAFEKSGENNVLLPRPQESEQFQYNKPFVPTPQQSEQYQQSRDNTVSCVSLQPSEQCREGKQVFSATKSFEKWQESRKRFTPIKAFEQCQENRELSPQPTRCGNHSAADDASIPGELDGSARHVTHDSRNKNSEKEGTNKAKVAIQNENISSYSYRVKKNVPHDTVHDIKQQDSVVNTLPRKPVCDKVGAFEERSLPTNKKQSSQCSNHSPVEDASRPAQVYGSTIHVTQDSKHRDNVHDMVSQDPVSYMLPHNHVCNIVQSDNVQDMTPREYVRSVKPREDVHDKMQNDNVQNSVPWQNVWHIAPRTNVGDNIVRDMILSNDAKSCYKQDVRQSTCEPRSITYAQMMKQTAHDLERITCNCPCSAQRTTVINMNTPKDNRRGKDTSFPPARSTSYKAAVGNLTPAHSYLDQKSSEYTLGHHYKPRASSNCQRTRRSPYPEPKESRRDSSSTRWLQLRGYQSSRQQHPEHFSDVSPEFMSSNPPTSARIPNSTSQRCNRKSLTQLKRGSTSVPARPKCSTCKLFPTFPMNQPGYKRPSPNMCPSFDYENNFLFKTKSNTDFSKPNNHGFYTHDEPMLGHTRICVKQPQRLVHSGSSTYQQQEPINLVDRGSHGLVRKLHKIKWKTSPKSSRKSSPKPTHKRRQRGLTPSKECPRNRGKDLIHQEEHKNNINADISSNDIEHLLRVCKNALGESILETLEKVTSAQLNKEGQNIAVVGVAETECPFNDELNRTDRGTSCHAYNDCNGDQFSSLRLVQPAENNEDMPSVENKTTGASKETCNTKGETAEKDITTYEDDNKTNAIHSEPALNERQNDVADNLTYTIEKRTQEHDNKTTESDTAENEEKADSVTKKPQGNDDNPSSDLKNTFTDVKKTLAEVKNTFADVKNTFMDVKNTFFDVKNTFVDANRISDNKKNTSDGEKNTSDDEKIYDDKKKSCVDKKTEDEKTEDEKKISEDEKTEYEKKTSGGEKKRSEDEMKTSDDEKYDDEKKTSEDEKSEDERPEDEKTEDEKTEDEKTEDEKTEDEKTEDEKTEDEKTEDEKTEDEKTEDEEKTSEDEKTKDEKRSPEDEKTNDEKKTSDNVKKTTDDAKANGDERKTAFDNKHPLCGGEGKLAEDMGTQTQIGESVNISSLFKEIVHDAVALSTATLLWRQALNTEPLYTDNWPAESSVDADNDLLPIENSPNDAALSITDVDKVISSHITVDTALLLTENSPNDAASAITDIEKVVSNQIKVAVNVTNSVADKETHIFDVPLNKTVSVLDKADPEKKYCVKDSMSAVCQTDECMSYGYQSTRHRKKVDVHTSISGDMSRHNYQPNPAEIITLQVSKSVDYVTTKSLDYMKLLYRKCSTSSLQTDDTGESKGSTGSVSKQQRKLTSVRSSHEIDSEWTSSFASAISSVSSLEDQFSSGANNSRNNSRLPELNTNCNSTKQTSGSRNGAGSEQTLRSRYPISLSTRTKGSRTNSGTSSSKYRRDSASRTSSGKTRSSQRTVSQESLHRERCQLRKMRKSLMTNEKSLMTYDDSMFETEMEPEESQRQNECRMTCREVEGNFPAQRDDIKIFKCSASGCPNKPCIALMAEYSAAHALECACKHPGPPDGLPCHCVWPHLDPDTAPPKQFDPDQIPFFRDKRIYFPALAILVIAVLILAYKGVRTAISTARH